MAAHLNLNFMLFPEQPLELTLNCVRAEPVGQLTLKRSRYSPVWSLSRSHLVDWLVMDVISAYAQVYLNLCLEPQLLLPSWKLVRTMLSPQSTLWRSKCSILLSIASLQLVYLVTGSGVGS